MHKLGVFLIPSLYFNQVRVRGALTFRIAFKAIYAPDYEPEVCQECRTCTLDMEHTGTYTRR
jgi:hypothetical protein